MPQKIRTQFGFKGSLEDVEFEIPDNEPMPWSASDNLHMVSAPMPRLDARAKVTGQAKYTYDVNRPGMLYGRILRSPYAAADIKKIDTSKAEALPGVKAIEVLPIKTVRYAGQDIAAVAAISAQIAEDALRLITVEYAQKGFVYNIEGAMKPDAPLVHEAQVKERTSGGDLPAGGQSVPQTGNVRGPRVNTRGEIAKGFAEAEETVEATFHTQVQTHSSLETHGIVAEWQGDKLTVWASTQGTFSVRDELADVLGIAKTNVRVITEFMGGGFGSKFGAGSYGVLAAKLAKKANAPVKMMLTRKDEQLATGNRPNSIQKLKLGAKRDGTLTAMQIVVHGTGGVGGGAGAARPLLGLYDCPNKNAEEYDVFINAGPAAAMRAPGHPQGAFALESAIDMMAEKLGLDPFEFRRKNDKNPVRLAEMELGAARIGWERRNKVAGAGTGSIKRGIGMANGLWYNTGRPGAQAQIKIHSDGTVELFNGAQDIGTGIRTIIAQVTAEELGLSLNDIKVRFGDTEFPFGPGSGGSTTTPSLTPAVRAAAMAARQKLFEIARGLLQVSPETALDARGGKIFVKAEPTRAIDFKRVASHITGDTLTVQGDRVQNYKSYRDTVAGVQFAEVEVDTETGQVRVLKVVAIHDCGRPLNRLTSRSQINGGVIQGLSYALYEDRILDPQTGRMVNANLEQYKIAGALDMPLIEPILFDVYNGSNNTGAVGIGEPTVVPTAAAIANAVYNAIGVRIFELPITPARVLAALGRNKEAKR
ncbi:MAG: xanthine dehydrogenase family protein molybdopterin-binding subunit [Acidobacteriota bacterium]